METDGFSARNLQLGHASGPSVTITTPSGPIVGGGGVVQGEVVEVDNVVDDDEGNLAVVVGGNVEVEVSTVVVEEEEGNVVVVVGGNVEVEVSTVVVEEEEGNVVVGGNTVEVSMVVVVDSD